MKWMALAGGLLLAIAGCGGSTNQPPTTQFSPVEDETPAPKASPIKKPGATALNSGEKEGTDEVPAKASKPAKAKGNDLAGGEGQQAAGKSDEDPALKGPTAGKIKRLRQLLSPPEGETEQEMAQNMLRQLPAALATAEEILADNRAPTEARDEALFARFQIGSMMKEFNLDKNAKAFLEEAATDLATSTNPKFAMLARLQLFQLHVMDTLQLQPRDAKEVLAALKTLLESGISMEMVQAQVIPIGQRLEQLGYTREGVQSLEMIGDHFAKSEDTNETIFGRQMQASSLIGKVRQSDDGAKEVSEKLLAKAKEIIDLFNGDPKGIEAVRVLAQGLEGDVPDAAGKLYDLIEADYSESANPKTADRAQTLVAAGRKRLTLPGQAVTVTGVDIEGNPFDWSGYRGKVVLIHFWAITNEDFRNNLMMQELSNVAQLQKKHEERGLQVVGVNVNKDPRRVDGLFGDQKLPWPTVIGAKSSEHGVNIPVAKTCGITADVIPYNVLVGKDGKVAAVGLTGPPLDDAIIKALAAEGGAAPEKPTEDKPKSDEDKPQAEEGKEPAEKPGDKKSPEDQP
jgi:hypothetical protein